MYADDSNAFFTDSSLTKLEIMVNGCLNRLGNWLMANKLSLSLNQLQVTNHKFLGVWFNENRLWSAHVLNLVNNSSKTIGCFYKITNLIPTWFRVSKYYALFLFQNMILYSCVGNFNRLPVLQKKNP